MNNDFITPVMNYLNQHASTSNIYISQACDRLVNPTTKKYDNGKVEAVNHEIMPTQAFAYVPTSLEDNLNPVTFTKETLRLKNFCQEYGKIIEFVEGQTAENKFSMTYARIQTMDSQTNPMLIEICMKPSIEQLEKLRQSTSSLQQTIWKELE